MVDLVSDFLLFFLISVIILLFLVTLRWVLGSLSSPSNPSELKNRSYTGGKAVQIKQATFKTIFFQYAIYFLIFDVVAFVTGLSGFISNETIATLSISQWDLTSHVLVYLSIILFLFFLLPKHRDEVI